MRIILASILLVAVVGVIVLFLPTSDTAPEPLPTELARYGEVPPFQLVDQDGQAFKSEDLAGKVWLANFIFTSCAVECPVLSARMADVRKDLGPRNDLAFLSFSVDPQTDTPSRLAEYAEPYGTDARWKLLTGDPKNLDTLVKRDLLLPTARNLRERSEIVDSHFVHSNKMLVIDQEGIIRYHIDGLEPHAPARLAEAAARLLAGQ